MQRVEVSLAYEQHLVCGNYLFKIGSKYQSYFQHKIIAVLNTLFVLFETLYLELFIIRLLLLTST